MFHNLEKITAYKSKVYVKLDINPNEESIQTMQQVLDTKSAGVLSSEFDIQVDSIDKENIKAKLNVKGEYINHAEQLNAEAQIRIVNKQLYINLKKLPEQFGGSILTSFNNQWIKFDISDLTASTPQAQQLFLSSEPDTYKKIKENESVIKAAYMRNKFIIFDKSLTTETINSVATKHYRFKIDKDKLYAFYAEVMPLITNITPSESKEITRMLTEQNNTHDISSNITGGLWIGKNDTLPYKMNLDISMEDPQTAQKSTMYISIEFTNFNVPLDIQAPANAISPYELDKEMMQNL